MTYEELKQKCKCYLCEPLKALDCGKEVGFAVHSTCRIPFLEDLIDSPGDEDYWVALHWIGDWYLYLIDCTALY